MRLPATAKGKIMKITLLEATAILAIGIATVQLQSRDTVAGHALLTVGRASQSNHFYNASLRSDQTASAPALTRLSVDRYANN